MSATIVQDIPAGLAQGLAAIDLAAWIRGAAWLFIGIPLTLAVSRWVRAWVSTNANPQQGLIVGKLIWYAGLFGILVTVLVELGFSLAPLLGAAGVLGVALGFASQTSVSNVISGFFLMAEQPFVVGDLIEVGTFKGVVQSIDMISVKLRTFDNRFIRIPNETLVKSEVINVTRYPIRRVDVLIGVAYKEDLDHVQDVLRDVARSNPLCLVEPEPQILLQGFGESSLDLKFGVWATSENYFTLKNEIHRDIKVAFDRAGIEIPFPHRTLYAGTRTDAFPVRLNSPRSADEPPAPPEPTS